MVCVVFEFDVTAFYYGMTFVTNVSSQTSSLFNLIALSTECSSSVSQESNIG
jgi:hypothetical protein